MCFSSGPGAPPPTPAPPQAERAPDMNPMKRRNAVSGIGRPAGSTLLTGPSGIADNMLLNTGNATLLGGN